MSRAYQIDRHIDREEARLSELLNRGEITPGEFNAEMRLLQQEAREAFQEDMDDAQQQVRDEWGW